MGDVAVLLGDVGESGYIRSLVLSSCSSCSVMEAQTSVHVEVINASLFISGHCVEPACLPRITTLFITKTVLLII